MWFNNLLSHNFDKFSFLNFHHVLFSSFFYRFFLPLVIIIIVVIVMIDFCFRLHFVPSKENCMLCFKKKNWSCRMINAFDYPFQCILYTWQIKNRLSKKSNDIPRNSKEQVLFIYWNIPNFVVIESSRRERGEEQNILPLYLFIDS